MKYCPFCGSGLQEAMIFCPKCGKRFLDAFENPETKASVEGEKNIVEDPMSVQASEITQAIGCTSKVDAATEKEDQPSKKVANKGIWIVVIAFVIVLIACGIFFAGGAGKSVSVTDAANSVLYLEVCDDTDSVIASASGFIIEDGTTLVTNYHVIEGAHHILAYTPDGENSVEIHTVLAYDEDTDLAILKCEESIGVPPLLLDDSEDVKQGDEVFAVGYPLGVANTLSEGVVSSRYVDEYGNDILQITAAISNGSSGGALFNKKGQVIGVVCASYIDGQNLNIAISSNNVKTLLSGDANEIRLAILYNEYLMEQDPTIGLTESEKAFWKSLQGVWKYDGGIDFDIIHYLTFEGRNICYETINNSRSEQYQTSEMYEYGTFTIEGNTIIISLDSWEYFKDGKMVPYTPHKLYFEWTPTEFTEKMMQFDWCYPPFYKLEL